MTDRDRSKVPEEPSYALRRLDDGTWMPVAVFEERTGDPDQESAEWSIERHAARQQAIGAEKERERWVAWLTQQLAYFPDPEEPVRDVARDVDHEMLLSAANTIRNIRDVMASGAPPAAERGTE